MCAMQQTICTAVVYINILFFKMADGESKSFSFSFTKKKDTKPLQKPSTNLLGTERHKDEDDEVDFIRSAEGNKLRR